MKKFFRHFLFLILCLSCYTASAGTDDNVGYIVGNSYGVGQVILFLFLFFFSRPFRGGEGVFWGLGFLLVFFGVVAFFFLLFLRFSGLFLVRRGPRVLLARQQNIIRQPLLETPGARCRSGVPPLQHDVCTVYCRSRSVVTAAVQCPAPRRSGPRFFSLFRGGAGPRGRPLFFFLPALFPCVRLSLGGGAFFLARARALSRARTRVALVAGAPRFRLSAGRRPPRRDPRGGPSQTGVYGEGHPRHLGGGRGGPLSPPRSSENYVQLRPRPPGATAGQAYPPSPGDKGACAIHFFARPYSTASLRSSFSIVFLPSRAGVL